MSIIVSRLPDVTLHSRTYGPPDGPLALCLHGFPDSAATFRLLAPRLVQLGYRVVIPYMRGYAPSSLSTTNDYHSAALAGDASALHESLGGDERAILVGHDWGAVATYLASSAEPERWRRTVTLAIPPLPVLANAMGDFDQLRASWYMFYLRGAGAANVVRRDRMAFLERLWSTWSPNYDAHEDLHLVHAALQGDGHLEAALGYYRAMFEPPAAMDASLSRFRDAAFATSTVSNLYLHGEADGCILATSVLDPLDHMAKGSRYEMVAGAGHFLHLEQPDEVGRMIEEFVSP
ncbi:MAG: alpha/beta hydrolase [Acidimicrobiaceae bacterium]|nr:alpha/beta hydrolase [Acidimicrobiaceae bacterium]